jgi:hypothetical protein
MTDYFTFYILLPFIAAAIGAVFGVMALLWRFERVEAAERKRKGY